MEGMKAHQLARRLLELPDEPVVTVNGDLVTEASLSSYDDGSGDVPCITLDLEEE
jgi:hypothetical protein